MTEPVRVVVADDQVLLRHSLVALLESTGQVTVVAEAGDGATAVAEVRRAHPDVALLDIRMPETDGIAATRMICSDPDLADVRVCILTMFELDDYLFGALRAGACGFLLKDTTPEVLIRALHTIRAGDQVLSPSSLRRVIARCVDAPSRHVAAPEALTPREVEVLQAIGGGLSNAEIQATLFISRGTLKTHIGHLLMKLGARDRAQLVIAAYEHGLVD